MSDEEIDIDVQVESLLIIFGMEDILPANLAEPHERVVSHLSTRATRTAIYNHI